MKLLNKLIFVIAVLACLPLYSQQTSDNANVILYDPLFWKDDLKLNSDQCERIKDINIEFFHRINSLTSELENRSLLKRKTSEILTDRSEKIWSTFLPRQKRKWKKISAEVMGSNS